MTLIHLLLKRLRSVIMSWCICIKSCNGWRKWQELRRTGYCVEGPWVRERGVSSDDGRTWIRWHSWNERVLGIITRAWSRELVQFNQLFVWMGWEKKEWRGDRYSRDGCKIWTRWYYWNQRIRGQSWSCSKVFCVDMTGENWEVCML
jgi:hypothetical protein